MGGGLAKVFRGGNVYCAEDEELVDENDAEERGVDWCEKGEVREGASAGIGEGRNR